MKSTSSQYSRYFTYIKPVTRLPIIKNYGPAIFALLTISVLAIFAIKPTVETILVLQKDLASKEELLKKVTDKANNLSLGKKNYDEMDKTIKERISDSIPDNLSLKSVISALEQSASSHDASVSALQIQPLTIRPKDNDKTGTLSEISFVFNTEGDFAKLVDLLQDLKRSSRLVSIDSLSISKTTDGTSLIMSLTGKAYYLK